MKAAENLKNVIKKELIMNEQEIIMEILPKVKRLIRLTNDGKVILVADKSRIPKIYQLLLYLIGKRLAKMAELVESPDASIKELSEELGFPENYTRALLSELSSKNLITRSEKGLYNVKPLQIQEAISIIESKLGGEGE